jgi:hypothetical protein
MKQLFKKLYDFINSQYIEFIDTIEYRYDYLYKTDIEVKEFDREEGEIYFTELDFSLHYSRDIAGNSYENYCFYFKEETKETLVKMYTVLSTEFRLEEVFGVHETEIFTKEEIIDKLILHDDKISEN